MTYLDLGEQEKAYEVSGVLRDEEPMRAIEMVGRAEAEAVRGNETAARQLLSDAISSGDYFDAVFITSVFVYLGDYETALEWIDRAIRDHATGILLFRTGPYRASVINHPNFIKFRTNHRYRELMDQLNFPPLPPEHPGYADEQAWLANRSVR
jgi:hypothetical protein